MSLIARQRTCAACGRPIEPGVPVNIEPLIDPSVRYIVVHWDESTFRKPMALDPHILPLNYKANQPQTTIVLHVPTADCSIIETLMKTYGPGLPPKLISIFEQCIRQLPKE